MRKRIFRRIFRKKRTFERKNQISKIANSHKKSVSPKEGLFEYDLFEDET